MLPALPLYSQLAALNDPVVQAALAAQQSLTTTVKSESTTTPTGSRDTTHTKIFVGGLPYHTTDQTLHDYFQQFGDIEEAVVITDRQTQKSRGYGFVTMKDRTDAEKACRDPNPIIDGRKANVNLAYLGAKPRNNAHLAALSTSLTLPQLQAAQLQAALLQQQQQQQQQQLGGRIGLTQQLYLQSGALGQQLGVNPLAMQLAAAAAAQSQPNTLAAVAAQQAAVAAAVNPLLQHHQQQQQQPDYNQLLLAAAAANNPQQSATAASLSAGYGVPVSAVSHLDYTNAAAVANAYQFLQQQQQPCTSSVTATTVTNAQNYAAQLAAQAQLAAAQAAAVSAGGGVASANGCHSRLDNHSR